MKTRSVLLEAFGVFFILLVGSIVVLIEVRKKNYYKRAREKMFELDESIRRDFSWIADPESNREVRKRANERIVASEDMIDTLLDRKTYWLYMTHPWWTFDRLLEEVKS